MVIRRIGVLSAAKVSGALYALMGLFLGAIFSLFSLLGSMMALGTDENAFFGLIFGVGAIIVMPIFYGGLGAITAAIGALLYNLIAGTLGGLEIEMATAPQHESPGTAGGDWQAAP